MDARELEKYLVSGITVVNLTCMQKYPPYKVLNFYGENDLNLREAQSAHMPKKRNTRDSSFQAYVLFSPTVIGMDRNGDPLEIIVGRLQVTVADVNKDKTLELVAKDASGNVVSLNDEGTLTWEAKASGSSSSGSRLVDVDQDSYVDMIITTNAG